LHAHRRRQIAEEKAAKTAVQLIFPLVLFIFPGIFVILVGPSAILIMQKMFLNSSRKRHENLSAPHVTPLL
jgi:tight adherence protein C